MPRLASLFFSEINTFFALQFRCSPPLPRHCGGSPRIPKDYTSNPARRFSDAFCSASLAYSEMAAIAWPFPMGTENPDHLMRPSSTQHKGSGKVPILSHFLACSKIGRSAVCTLRCIPPPAAGEYMRIWNTPIFVDPEMRRGLKAAENIVF